MTVGERGTSYRAHWALFLYPGLFKWKLERKSMPAPNGAREGEACGDEGPAASHQLRRSPYLRRLDSARSCCMRTTLYNSILGVAIENIRSSVKQTCGPYIYPPRSLEISLLAAAPLKIATISRCQLAIGYFFYSLKICPAKVLSFSSIIGDIHMPSLR